LLEISIIGFVRLLSASDGSSSLPGITIKSSRYYFIAGQCEEGGSQSGSGTR
jgi:hypothetical protein